MGYKLNSDECMILLYKTCLRNTELFKHPYIIN